MPDFGNLADGRPFWTGNFTGGPREGILFYSPSDSRWWLGMLVAGKIDWSQIGQRTLTSTWKGRFTQATRDELLMYDGDGWTIASWKDGKFEWIDAGSTRDILGSPLFFEKTPFFPRLLSWTGNFTNDPENRDSLLFYDPAKADWKAGTWNGTSLDWRNVGNTATFGTDLEPDHRFWTGRFSKNTVDEVLFHYSGDKNWHLGTWDGTKLDWKLVNTDTFGDGLNELPFLVGNFNGDSENRDGVLFFYQPDGNWWLGTFEGEKLEWQNAANTAGLFAPTVTVLSLTTGPRFWTSNGKYVLAFDGVDKWYRAGDGRALSWTHIGSSAKFGNVGDGRPMFVLDMLGDGSPQVVFYYFRDGNWLHGRELLQTLVWNVVSNTGAVPEESGFFESLGTTILDGINTAYDAVASVAAPAVDAISSLVEAIPVIGPFLGAVIGWAVRVITTLVTLF
ncbi:MAG: hypothetical protein JWO97_672, partial [Acidobacteria bacterium]|nr:hypothetical protein [Acidobacteriota bacterium]